MALQALSRRVRFRRTMNKYWMHYLMVLPAIVLLFMFSYIPMYGIVIAFQNYKLKSGLMGFFTSQWVGFKNFQFLTDKYFWMTVENTFNITIVRFFITWWMPIAFAIMVNEIKGSRFKRTVQTITYLPNFISWIIVAYLINQLLALDTGTVNGIIKFFGGEQIYFMGDPKLFRPIVIIAGIWKSLGWSTIVYLAALSNIDPQLQEAAIVDGAKRYQRIWHIDLPGILPIVAISLILGIPSVLSAGYDMIKPLQNSANFSVSNVLEVYAVTLGLVQAKYSLSTAIGLVTSLVSLILVLSTNFIARLLGQDGLF